MYFESMWREQMKDMDAEDRKFISMLNKKIYPNGLFNLTSNPLFYIYSLNRKLKAINTILSQEKYVRKEGIYYDTLNNVVYFKAYCNLYHKCDLNTRQVQILPNDCCVRKKDAHDAR